MGSGASGRLAARRSRLRPTLAAAAGQCSQIRCTQAGSSLWPQHVCTARRRAVGTACVPCSASIERVEIEQVGERDRSVAADPDAQREGMLDEEDWQRDEFLLRAGTHAHSWGNSQSRQGPWAGLHLDLVLGGGLVGDSRRRRRRRWLVGVVGIRRGGRREWMQLNTHGRPGECNVLVVQGKRGAHRRGLPRVP